MQCSRCSCELIIKAGKDRKDKQVYRCKSCNYRFVEHYEAGRLTDSDKALILKCQAEGLGMRATARILGIKTWENVRYFLKKVTPEQGRNLGSIDMQ